jgi:hypothetical protein
MIGGLKSILRADEDYITRDAKFIDADFRR